MIIDTRKSDFHVESLLDDAVLTSTFFILVGNRLFSALGSAFFYNTRSELGSAFL